MSPLTQAVVLFAAAVLIVPLFRRFGLGSVLGYLAAGLIAGPSGLAAIAQPTEILHFAELGVVLLLFLIGLELEPRRLWTMRRLVLGLGGSQIVGTGLVLGALGLALGLTWQAAALAGVALALSSTAFAMQLLNERNEMATPHGRTAFAILLAQDLAVIPVLAAVPLLAVGPGAESGSSAVHPLLTVAVVVGVLLGGRHVLRPLLRLAVSARIAELSIGAALLVVLAVGDLMEHVGLSMGLGAFVAGVLLADSTYRHELQANIEPFKGLLLGLFFMAVGMNTDLAVMASAPVVVVGLAVALVVAKMGLLAGLGRMAGLASPGRLRLAAALGQGGEFAFVLLEAGRARAIIDGELGGLLTLAVTLSMVLTPVAFALVDRWIARRPPEGDAARPFDELEPERGGQVVLAGFGRYAQIVARVLTAKRIRFTALENDPAQVDFVRRWGNRVFYGDPARPDLLRTAVTDAVRVFVVAVDDVEASLAVAREVRHLFPALRVHARARNRAHAHALMALGVEAVYRETFASSLETAQNVLEDLGLATGDAVDAVRRFREHDEKLLAYQFTVRDDEQALLRSAREWATELEQLFEHDTGRAAPDPSEGREQAEP